MASDLGTKKNNLGLTEGNNAWELHYKQEGTFGTETMKITNAEISIDNSDLKYKGKDWQNTHEGTITFKAELKDAFPLLFGSIGNAADESSYTHHITDNTNEVQTEFSFDTTTVVNTLNDWLKSIDGTTLEYSPEYWKTKEKQIWEYQKPPLPYLPIHPKPVPYDPEKHGNLKINLPEIEKWREEQEQKLNQYIESLKGQLVKEMHILKTIMFDQKCCPSCRKQLNGGFWSRLKHKLFSKRTHKRTSI